jgi:hypothetical protein
MPERWLADGVAISLEAPWEAARKNRIWQLVWAGLFRGIETPHWELPTPPEATPVKKSVTRIVLDGWLPAPDSRLTHAQMTRLLDDSWLADDRLFCAIPPLRRAATRSRWHVDATRQALALSLYRLEEGKAAKELNVTVPKYLPELPTDPYSGQPYRFRIAGDEVIVWSTGPDRVDHGGHRHGGKVPDDDPLWRRGELDLIKTLPHAL